MSDDAAKAIQDLGLELDHDAQLMVGRVLKLAKIRDRADDLARRSTDVEKPLPPLVEK